MRLPHHPELLAALRDPSEAEPWRVLISGCLADWPVTTDGHSMGALRPSWLAPPLVELIPFCPEDYRIGTPRGMPDLHGGDGFAVLDGRAQVLDEHDYNLTPWVIDGAHAMVALAQERTVDFALLLDRSGTCGSQVVSLGCRLVPPVNYVKGVGVATAALLRAGVHVVSQRDYQTLERLHAKLDPSHSVDPEARDHHEHPWVLEHLG